MKKLFPILAVCSLLLTSCSAPGTPVMLPLQSFFNGANYSRPVQITAVHQWLTDYTNIYLGSFTTVTPTGGTNPVVNLRPNDYILTAPDVRVPLRFTVYATNAVVNILSLLPSNSPVLAYFPVIPWGGVAGGFSGIITNLFSLAGPLVTNLSVAGSDAGFLDGSYYPTSGLFSWRPDR